jgi:AcrR family transcriptional regulator
MAIKRRDGIKAKKKILQAAALAFSKVGYHDAKVADICKAAGTNVASVNYYFGSKEELYGEAWRHSFAESIKKYPVDGGVSEDALPEEKLRGNITAFINRVVDPKCIEFEITHKEMANPTGLLHEIMKKSLEPLRQRFVGIIREILGDDVDELTVQMCEMSVHSQCFSFVMRFRKHRMLSEKGEKHFGPPPLDVSPKVIVEHIIKFSLAGLSAIREDEEKKLLQKKSDKKKVTYKKVTKKKV